MFFSLIFQERKITVHFYAQRLFIAVLAEPVLLAPVLLLLRLLALVLVGPVLLTPVSHPFKKHIASGTMCYGM